MYFFTLYFDFSNYNLLRLRYEIKKKGRKIYLERDKETGVRIIRKKDENAVILEMLSEETRWNSSSRRWGCALEPSRDFPRIYLCGALIVSVSRISNKASSFCTRVARVASEERIERSAPNKGHISVLE